MSSLPEIFSPDGPLARTIDGYRVRAQQVEMAERIAGAIHRHDVLIAEAGTGTGKTFAYLVPALLSGGKVIISTGTKTLQDQLFNRDLPTVRDCAQGAGPVALLKGRANYVCHYHLERALADGRFLTREDARQLRAHRALRQDHPDRRQGRMRRCAGERAGLATVTSTRDNCLGQDCPHYKECFVMKARREAMEADVVVVNHHLFFADVMLRDEGVAELLPACNTVIFDEAHQLPETASLFFGDSLSTTQLLDLARDARVEAAGRRARLPRPADWQPGAGKGGARPAPGGAGRCRALLPRSNSQERAEFEPATAGRSRTPWRASRAMLETQAERSEGLENCWQRALELRQRLARWQNGGRSRHRALGRGVHAVAAAQRHAAVDRGDLQQADERPPARLDLHLGDAGGEGRFPPLLQRDGARRAPTALLGQPVRLRRAGTALRAARACPTRTASDYTEAVVEAALPVIAARPAARAFLLFTSLRAMRRAHELLQARLRRARAWTIPLLLQGEGTQNELLERFRHLGNAVLVGSQSFWEGVDVRGEALSLVVIDKLPFAPPDDPVLAARIEKMNNEGRNAFMEYQLPRAVITLKQGAGRLIRDETDRGVLMICDPRLISKALRQAHLAKPAADEADARAVRRP